MPKTIKPLTDRILVKDLPRESERKLDSGLYIPDSATPETQTIIGTVIEIGQGKYDAEGKKLRDLLVKKGDTVLYGKYAGQEVEMNREIFKVMIEDDILGTYE